MQGESVEMSVESDISSYRKNKNFILWMKTINGMSDEKVLSLTPENYIGGYCEDFALYFAIRYGVNMLFLNEEHDIVQIDGKFYDGFNSSGVRNLKDLHYVKTSESLNGLSEEKLRSLLRVDNDWKTYRPLKNNIYLIEKVR